MNKQVGHFEIQTYPDSDGVMLTYHHNASSREFISFRGANDLHDLRYAVDSALRERAERNK